MRCTLLQTKIGLGQRRQRWCPVHQATTHRCEQSRLIRTMRTELANLKGKENSNSEATPRASFGGCGGWTHRTFDREISALIFSWGQISHTLEKIAPIASIRRSWPSKRCSHWRSNHAWLSALLWESAGNGISSHCHHCALYPSASATFVF